MSRTMYPKAAIGRKIHKHPAARLLRNEPPGNHFTLRFDGSCRNNGRPDATGRWAFHLLKPDSTTTGLRSGAATGDPVTNNTAEWEGLINGLKHAAGTAGVESILIEGDSDLVIAQVTGRWKASKFSDEVHAALDILAEIGRPWFARWIPREENEFCDGMT